MLASIVALTSTLATPALAAVAPPEASNVGAAGTGLGLVDSTTGLWYLRNGDGGTATFFYGNPGDFPVVGDWDCNGSATPGLYRQSDGFAYLRNSNSQGNADIRFFFGNPSDVPLAGDFNGDGCDTLSIYRPEQQRFFIINALGANDGGLGAAEFDFVFGNPGDKPVVGDWDGDGIDEVGLHRESTGFFYFRNALSQGNADAQFFFGDPNDRFVAGDWGVVDGVDTPAIFRPSDATFYLRHSNSPGVADATLGMGVGAWRPVAGDFGTLVPRVAVSLPGAPERLQNVVSGLYSWLSAAAGLPPPLRALLGDQPNMPPAATLGGVAGVATVLGHEVAAVTVGSDVVLAVAESGHWRIVGAKLASLGKPAWYGASPKMVVILGADPIGNADTIQVLTAVPSSGQGALVGIPRDTWVQATYGLDKITSTMRDKGGGLPFGADVTLATLRSESGLPIQGYIRTGFSGFTSLVDSLGGFIATLVYTTPDGDPDIPPGTHFLNGVDALRVARHRVTLPSGDVDRTLNAGLLIEAVLVKLQASSVTTVPFLLDLLDNFATTDLSAEEWLLLGASAFEMNQPALPGVVVQGEWAVRLLFHENRNVGGWDITAENRAAFADLADGVFDPGRCEVALSKPSPQTACWTRP